MVAGCLVAWLFGLQHNKFSNFNVSVVLVADSALVHINNSDCQSEYE